MRASSRAASYQPEPSPSLTRAEPKTTTVVATPQLPQMFLGLLVLELEAQAAGGVAKQEIHVHGRQPVGRRGHLCLVRCGHDAWVLLAGRGLRDRAMTSRNQEG